MEQPPQVRNDPSFAVEVPYVERLPVPGGALDTTTWLHAHDSVCLRQFYGFCQSHAVNTVNASEKKRMKLPPPPANLVQLTSFPDTEWVGKTVYQPLAQSGFDPEVATPYWREADIPLDDVLRGPCHPDEDPYEYLYDVGVVVSFEPNEHLQRPEVTYRVTDGEDSYKLRGPAPGLWVEIKT